MSDWKRLAVLKTYKDIVRRYQQNISAAYDVIYAICPFSSGVNLRKRPSLISARLPRISPLMLGHDQRKAAATDECTIVHFLAQIGEVAGGIVALLAYNLIVSESK